MPKLPKPKITSPSAGEVWISKDKEDQTVYLIVEFGKYCGILNNSSLAAVKIGPYKKDQKMNGATMTFFGLEDFDKKLFAKHNKYLGHASEFFD